MIKKATGSFAADFVKNQNLTLDLHVAKCHWGRFFKCNLYCILNVFKKLQEWPEQLVCTKLDFQASCSKTISTLTFRIQRALVHIWLRTWFQFVGVPFQTSILLAGRWCYDSEDGDSKPQHCFSVLFLYGGKSLLVPFISRESQRFALRKATHINN